MPPPPAAALPPPHHRTVRRTTVVAAPVRLPSPVRPRRTSWRLPSRGDIVDREREGTATWNSPLRRSHIIVTTAVAAPVAAVARPSPVRPPSTVMAALSFRDTMDPDSWSVASKHVFLGTSPVARTSPVAPVPPSSSYDTLPKTRTFYVKTRTFYIH